MNHLNIRGKILIKLRYAGLLSVLLKDRCVKDVTYLVSCVIIKSIGEPTFVL